MLSDAGRLIGIAWRDARKAPMQTVCSADITIEAGLVGDHKGRKYKNRALTVLAKEDWARALRDVVNARGLTGSDNEADVLDLSWTVRRSNLLVEGVDLPKAPGGQLKIGEQVRLEVTYPCQPCRRMEEALPGLLKALHPDWRGGLVMKVITGGHIRKGDLVRVEDRPPRVQRRLP